MSKLYIFVKKNHIIEKGFYFNAKLFFHIDNFNLDFSSFCYDAQKNYIFSLILNFQFVLSHAMSLRGFLYTHATMLTKFNFLKIKLSLPLQNLDLFLYPICC